MTVPPAPMVSAASVWLALIFAVAPDATSREEVPLPSAVCRWVVPSFA